MSAETLRRPALRRRPLLLAGLALAALLAACSEPPADPVVATYRGGEIRASELEAWKRFQGIVDRPEGTPRRRMDAVESLALLRSLYAAALAAGLDRDPEVAAEIEAQVDARLAAALRRAVVAEVEVPPAEVDAYLAAHAAERQWPERRQLSYVWKKVPPGGDPEATRTEVEAIHARVLAGADFAALARAESDSLPTRNRGGRLGIARPGQLPEALDAALFALEEGGVSEVLPAGEGFAFLRCDRIFPSRVLGEEEARKRVVPYLRRPRAEAAWAELVASLGADGQAPDREARLAAEGRRRGLDRKPQLAQELELARAKVLAMAEQERRVAVLVPEPTEADLRAHLAAHPSAFQTPERYRLAVLWLRYDRDNAAERYGRLARAVDAIRVGNLGFAQAAAEVSQHPKAAPDGEIGWRTRPEVAALGPVALRAVQALAPGEVSDVVQERTALWVFKLLEHEPARLRLFAEVESELREGFAARQRAEIGRRVREETIAALELQRTAGGA
jgi:parvulin-like peptidyl-prolyl isomerase